MRGAHHRMFVNGADLVRCAVQAHMEGAPFLTKAELMSQADRSGLATRAGAIYGKPDNQRSLIRSQSKALIYKALHFYL